MGITQFAMLRGPFLLVFGFIWLGTWPVYTVLAASQPDMEIPCLILPSLQVVDSPEPLMPVPDDCSLTSSLSTAEFSRLLLPDLLTLPPYDLEIETLPDGSRELRLSNTIWNSGAGPLELAGEFNPTTRRTRVEQNVYSETSNPYSRLVGEFVWHIEHDHWHFENFSLYELWTLTPTGELEALVSSSDKVSYCLIDTDILDREMESFLPYRQYYGCGRTLQGLSVGWGDTYKSFLDGQSIQLAAVKDGYYALRSIANPDGILLEANYNNNSVLIYLVIHGETIELIDLEVYFDLNCQSSDWRLSYGIACKN
jgi:hypothetical protein